MPALVVPWWSISTTPRSLFSPLLRFGPAGIHAGPSSRGSLHVRQACFAFHFRERYGFCRDHDLLLTQQVPHGGYDAVHRELFAVTNLGIAAVGGEQFVFAVEQVEQGALSQTELLLIGLANASGVVRVITCLGGLQTGVLHGVPG